MAKDAKGHGSDSRGGGVGAAHQAAVNAVGQPTPAPNFRLNSYTHEVVSPTGEVVARMRLGKNSGVAVDYPAGARAAGKGASGPQIARSSGPSLHDAVSMPDYRANKMGQNSFPAEHIGGQLHYLTGNDFAGHTVRRVGDSVMRDWAGRTDADLEKDYGGPVRHYDGK